jgi:hypothetical protein
MSEVRETGTSAAAPEAGTEGLMKLHKMSTTAGVGSGDYVAVNGTAIAALGLGVATWLTLMHPSLLFIPVAGIICAVLALRQIGESNGTQAGRPLAIIGLLLSLGIGGWIAAKEVGQARALRADREAVAAAIATFGEQLRDNKLAEAYDSTSARFKTQVPRERFVATTAAVRVYERFGTLQHITSNNLAQFATEAGGERTAVAAGLLRFDKLEEPLRQTITLRLADGRWQIDAMPDLFPPPMPPGGAGGGPPPGVPGADPSGPPAPM